MPTVDEALIGTPTNPLSAQLKAGLEVIDQQAVVVFTRYVRLVLPLDGFVFWVRADLLSASALFNATPPNATTFNRPRAIQTPAAQLSAPGSLHYTSSNRQDQDESSTQNAIVFTSEVVVKDLNEVSPGVLYLATVDGRRYSFSRRNMFYRQADLYHYTGDAVYPALDTQIIDNANGFDSHNVVVSNSLPLWLGLNQFMPVYPSFLVDDNVSPPYASVHIGPDDTEALQAVANLGPDSSHYQLASDRVRVTLFGMRNFNALDYLDYVIDYMATADTMGLMNCPIVRDEKRNQVEISALAMKKSILFQVSYYQTRMRDIARQLILSCVPTYTVAYPEGVPIGRGGFLTSTIIPYSQNLALPYTGPFTADEVLQRIVFLQTTQLTRGVAYTQSTGDGVFEFYKNDSSNNPTLLALRVTCVAGQHYPQVSLPNGPQTFYIDEVMTPICISADPGLLDLTLTFGSNP